MRTRLVAVFLGVIVLVLLAQDVPLAFHLRRVETDRLLAGLERDAFIIGGNAADATAQATAQVMNRFLNRLPTITIREGHRVKVYVTSDLDLPAWAPLGAAAGSQWR